MYFHTHCGVTLLCLRSRMSILQQGRTQTPQRSLGLTQASGRRGQRSATVNPENRDSLALQDQRYWLISWHHSHFFLLPAAEETHRDPHSPRFSENTTLIALMEALLFSVITFERPHLLPHSSNSSYRISGGPQSLPLPTMLWRKLVERQLMCSSHNQISTFCLCPHFAFFWWFVVYVVFIVFTLLSSGLFYCIYGLG